jgi:hypothetical protein
MVAMTKILPTPPVFGQADLAGPWRVYLHRVESKLSGSTVQIGQLTFGSAGAFGGGTLRDALNAATSLTNGALTVQANGSVVGTLTVGTSPTADRYTITGTMRAAKDLITGVITTELNRATTPKFHHGLVTLVREVALLEFEQPTYSTAEGSPASIKVVRSGNLEGTLTVNYAVGPGGTALPGDFTVPPPGTLTFTPGQQSKTLAITTTANNVVDGSRTVNLLLSAPAIVTAPTGVSVLLGATAATTLTITDNDVAGTVRFGAASYTVAEATANASITVQRSGGAAASVVVQLLTSDGTAEAGRDYTSRNVSITFNAGETTKTLLVPITNTPLVDGSRTFTVAITGATPPSTVVGNPSVTTVTITDNDVAGSLQFSLAGYSITEPAAVTATATIVVTRTGGAAGGVLVDFVAMDGSATAGADYGATAGTLTFGAGNTSRTFTIPVFADALVEGDETVLLALSNARGGATLGAQKTATLTIKDAERGVQFSAANYTVNESQGTATITVVRTGPADGSATVSYSTSDGTAVGGTHYTPTSGTLSFGTNVTSKTFTVKVLPDKVVATPRTVLLLLSNPSLSTPLGPQSSATLTINNVDVAGTVKLGAATYSVNESVAAATVTITRSGGTAGAVTVDYTTADDCMTPPCPGKAQADVDYDVTSGTLTFNPGETSKTILIPITNDTTVEGNETFLFQISNPGGFAAIAAPTTATITIVDNDTGGVIQLSASTYQVTEPVGVSSTATIQLTRTGSNLAAGATVQLATSNGTATAGADYAATVTTVVFGANETSKSVPIPILPDVTAEGNEAVNITLSNPGGGASLGARTSAVLTIVDATSVVQFGATTYSVNEGAPATVTVVRGGPLNAPAVVGYSVTGGTAAAGTDYTAPALSAALTFTANVASKTFTLPTIKRAGDNGSRTVTLSLAPISGPIQVGPSNPTVLTIQDVDPPGTFQFGAATYSAAEGGVSPVTITRTGGGGGTVVVQWQATGGNATVVQDYTPAIGTVTFGPGVTSQKVSLTIVNDMLAETAETIALQLALAGSPPAGAALGAQATTTLTILDNDNGGTIRFATPAVTVPENVAGGKINLTLNRSGVALAGGVTVNYAASGDVGAVNLPPGALTFGPGQTSLVLPVPIVVNAVPEADRTVAITLSTPLSLGGATGANAPTLGTVVTATATIVDDEPRVQFSESTYPVVEGGIATVTVARSGSTAGTVTVNYATSNGTATAPGDYTSTSGTLTFGPNVLKQTFTVATVDNPAATGAKLVNLALTPGVGASIGSRNTATVTIQDGDSAGVVQFASAASSVVEGGTVRVFVSRTGNNLTGGVTVGWSATGGSATSPADFSPASGTLSFGPGVSVRSFDIATVGPDGVAEGTETIVLGLDPPTGGATLGVPGSATVLIVDAEQSLAFGSALSTVGETTTQATISVVRLGVPTGTVSVTAMTVTGTAIPDVPEAQPGVDYAPVGPVALTFNPGEIVKTFTVPIFTANALIQNGNRALGLALANPGGGAALGAQNTSALTILDFRPDLVVATVNAPSSTLTGKLVAAPTMVRNLGAVAAPAFRVGLFIAQGDMSAGAGQLVALRDVASLAPGASLSLPTQLTIAEDLPPGDYFVSAVVDFLGNVLEGDETNNGLGSAPSVLKVSKNLTKFQSASASFSLGDAPSGLGTGTMAALGTCDVSGSVNLTGSFTITSQQQDVATGVADLSGALNGGPFDGQPVRFVIGFTGTADDLGNVTATISSIAVSGAFSATGVGTPPGTFTGTLTGSTLSGNATGTIHTATGGDCAFSGPLTAVAQTSFVFNFGTRVAAGFIDFGTTPNFFPPVIADGYAARFHVLFESNPPDPSAVRFTGPAGSGFSGTPADPSESHMDDNGSDVTYTSQPRDGVAPGGTWSVLYKGVTRQFSVPPFDANRSLVVIYPTVTVDGNGRLTQVDWDYREPANPDNRLPGPPSFLRGLRVGVQLNQSGDHPESPQLAPTTLSYNFGAAAPEWARVNGIGFQYTDLLGNEYELRYEKTFNVQVETRLENVYGTFTAPTGSRERIINAFVDVPFNSVDAATCGSQGAGPFFVSVVHAAGGLPYSAPTCMERTSSTIFPNGTRLVDIFSLRDNLDTRFGSPLPPLPSGTQFQFDVTPTNPPLATQTVITSLQNEEADPLTDFIEIPNPATPTLKPAGFNLAAARLGQNLTVSWTLPTFEVESVDLTANVTADPSQSGSSGQLQAALTSSAEPFTLPPLTCTVNSLELPTSATSATFKFPTTCLGVPVTEAQFCIFVKGTAPDNKTSTACWFFQSLGPVTQFMLSQPTATFSQSGTSPAQASDGNFSPGNGWSILNGGTTGAEIAVWEAGGTFPAGQLQFELTFPRDMAIGRFRLSATSADPSTFADGAIVGGDVSTTWTVLTNPVMEGPATLTKLADNSILVSGLAPVDPAVFTVTYMTTLSNITGVRLEAIPDQSLPTNGPGVASDGNFLLTEMRVLHRPALGLTFTPSGSLLRPTPPPR